MKTGGMAKAKAKKYQAGGPVVGQTTSPSRPTAQQQFIDGSGPQMPGGGPNPNAVPFMPTGVGSPGGQTTSPRPPIGSASGSQPAPTPRPRPGRTEGSQGPGMQARMQMRQERVQAMKARMEAAKQASMQRRSGSATPAVMKKGGKVVAKKKGGMIKAKGSK